jgi:GNAT superfamily N-acetyltransferase
MEEQLDVSIEPMTEGDCEEAEELVRLSMNDEEACWARETMRFYFACKKEGIDSGREYYVWRRDGKIRGLVGLHRQIWGAEENVWLSWFAVHPEHHRKGTGGTLIDLITEKARQGGYKKLFVETYSSPTFEKARSFYKAKGFSEAGRIADYLPDGAAMIVFVRGIQSR